MGRNRVIIFFFLFYFILFLGFQRGKRREEENTGKVPPNPPGREREKNWAFSSTFVPFFGY